MIIYTNGTFSPFVNLHKQILPLGHTRVLELIDVAYGFHLIILMITIMLIVMILMMMIIMMLIIITYDIIY
jgi:hypothetical protein